MSFRNLIGFYYHSVRILRSNISLQGYNIVWFYSSSVRVDEINQLDVETVKKISLLSIAKILESHDRFTESFKVESGRKSSKVDFLSELVQKCSACILTIEWSLFMSITMTCDCKYSFYVSMAGDCKNQTSERKTSTTSSTSVKKESVDFPNSSTFMLSLQPWSNALDIIVFSFTTPTGTTVCFKRHTNPTTLHCLVDWMKNVTTMNDDDKIDVRKYSSTPDGKIVTYGIQWDQKIMKITDNCSESWSKRILTVRTEKGYVCEPYLKTNRKYYFLRFMKSGCLKFLLQFLEEKKLLKLTVQDRKIVQIDFKKIRWNNRKWHQQF